MGPQKSWLHAPRRQPTAKVCPEDHQAHSGSQGCLEVRETHFSLPTGTRGTKPPPKKEGRLMTQEEETAALWRKTDILGDKETERKQNRRP